MQQEGAVVGGHLDKVVARVEEFGVGGGQGGAVVHIVGEGGEGEVVVVKGAFGKAVEEFVGFEAVGLPMTVAVQQAPRQRLGLRAQDVELQHQAPVSAEGEHGEV